MSNQLQEKQDEHDNDPDMDPYNHYIQEAQKVSSYDPATWEQVGLMEPKELEEAMTKRAEDMVKPKQDEDDDPRPVIVVSEYKMKPICIAPPLNPWDKFQQLLHQRDGVMMEIISLLGDEDKEPEPDTKEGKRIIHLRSELTRLEMTSPYTDYRNYKRQILVRSFTDTMRELRILNSKDERKGERNRREKKLIRQRDKLKADLLRNAEIGMAEKRLANAPSTKTMWPKKWTCKL